MEKNYTIITNNRGYLIMSKHEKFNFKTREEFDAKIKELGVDVKLSDDLSPLAKPVKVGHRTAPNAFAVLPMEGCDSNPDGSPSELLTRRYERFAGGGAGLLWWEANAVVKEGKANPLQMMLTDENKGSFAEMIKKCNDAAKNLNGKEHEPVNILQLTHSGRYSRPNTHAMEPLVPQHDPTLDPRVGIDANDNKCIVTDEYLDSLPEKYIKSALLAKEVGFDGVDIKSCHRYLFSELLASHTRGGKYGGSFENRTRLLCTILEEVKKACGNDFIISTRFNVFDAHPYPYGWGVDKEDMWKFDPTEPVQLIKRFKEIGVDLLGNSAGNPYYIYAQVGRPFDTSSAGIPVPEEHQLESVERLFALTKLVQETAGDIPVIGSGYSWLRQFAPYAGAYNVANGHCGFVGLGRSSFAYPEAPRDILTTGVMDPKKCCIACSKCTQIMRDHGRTGCVVRDSKVYMPLFKEAQADAAERAGAK